MANRLTQLRFLEKAISVHGDRYDYSLVEYVNSKEKLPIICKIHGVFKMTPNCHIHKKQNCPKCSLEGNKLSQDEFIKRVKKYKKKYDYTLVNYVNNYTKIRVICLLHGEFLIRPWEILSGRGCPICAGNRKKTNEQFIRESIKIHGDKYDYSLVEYKNLISSVDIICPKHGVFKQISRSHLRGKGCPNCKTSKLEKNVEDLFKINNIKFYKEKSFSWLKHKNKLRLDFYLPDHNIAIECQGIQHFKPVSFSDKSIKYINNDFEYRVYLDNVKKSLCVKNGIKILYYSNIKEAKNCINNTEELLEKIIKS